MIARRTVAPLLAVCLALFACKLMKPSPKKLCAKADKLMAESLKSESSASSGGKSIEAECVADLEKMKKDSPQEYECTSTCISDAKDAAGLSTCMKTCKGSSTTASTSDDDDSKRTYPVDSLTPSDVRSKISSAYYSYGYDITGEKENSVGWSANVALGKKGAYGEVHIYKVLLVDILNRKDGFSTATKLAEGQAANETRVGNKKLLVVRCLYQRTGTETGVPKECGAYDSKISSFTDDIATSR